MPNLAISYSKKMPLSAEINYVKYSVTPSPYSRLYTVIYILNAISNGWFTLIFNGWFMSDSAQEPGKLSGKIVRKNVAIEDDSIHVSLCCLPELKPTIKNIAPIPDETIKEILSNSDCVIANLETSVALIAQERRSTSLNFQVAPDFVRKTWENFSVDPSKVLISVANNHGNDAGGVGQTINLLERNKLGYCIGSSIRERGPIAIITIKNVRIGIVACTRWMNYQPNISYDTFRNIPIYRIEDIEAMDWPQLKNENNLSALVLYVHCGHEQSPHPYDKDIECFHKLTQSFDAIIGHGSHTLQTTEERDESVIR